MPVRPVRVGDIVIIQSGYGYHFFRHGDSVRIVAVRDDQATAEGTVYWYGLDGHPTPSEWQSILLNHITPKVKEKYVPTNGFVKFQKKVSSNAF